MAKKAYIGVSNVAHRVKKIYLGVGGVAKKVRKGYIGVNGIARLFYISGTGISYLRQAPDASPNRGEMIGAGNPSYAIFAGGFSFGAPNDDSSNNESYADVDAYDRSCVHYYPSDLGTASYHGNAAQAGNYAVFYMYRNKVAYNESLTQTGFTGISTSPMYVRNQGCTFNDHAVLLAGQEIVEEEGAVSIKQKATVIDGTLAVSANVEVHAGDGVASAATEEHCFLAGGREYNSNTGYYSYSNKVTALDATYTKVALTSTLSLAGAPSGAATANHAFFRAQSTYAGGGQCVDAFDDNLTKTAVPNTGSIYFGVGEGASFGGFAIFPGPTALSLIDDSLTITQLPFSVDSFPLYTNAVSGDRLFFAGEYGVTKGQADMSVHVFESY